MLAMACGGNNPWAFHTEKAFSAAWHQLSHSSAVKVWQMASQLGFTKRLPKKWQSLARAQNATAVSKFQHILAMCWPLLVPHVPQSFSPRLQFSHQARTVLLTRPFLQQQRKQFFGQLPAFMGHTTAVNCPSAPFRWPWPVVCSDPSWQASCGLSTKFTCVISAKRLETSWKNMEKTYTYWSVMKSHYARVQNHQYLLLSFWTVLQLHRCPMSGAKKVEVGTWNLTAERQARWKSWRVLTIRSWEPISLLLKF